MLTLCIKLCNLQAVEQLKMKLQGLQALYLSQLQLVHTAVHAHEASSTSTFKALNSTVTAHPKALEQVRRLWVLFKMRSVVVEMKSGQCLHVALWIVKYLSGYLSNYRYSGLCSSS